MILLSETLPSIPLPGIIILVAFAVILVMAFMGDKKNRKLCFERINATYNDKILEKFSGKHYWGFITNEGEFVIGLKSGNCIHRIYKLSDISYVESSRDYSTRQWYFKILDADRKSVKGMTFYPLNKKKKSKMTSEIYYVTPAEADAYCALIMKYADHVKHSK